jgi:hypothetical protein
MLRRPFDGFRDSVRRIREVKLRLASLRVAFRRRFQRFDCLVDVPVQEGDLDFPRRVCDDGMAHPQVELFRHPRRVRAEQPRVMFQEARVASFEPDVHKPSDAALREQLPKPFLALRHCGPAVVLAQGVLERDPRRRLVGVLVVSRKELVAYLDDVSDVVVFVGVDAAAVDDVTLKVPPFFFFFVLDLAISHKCRENSFRRSAHISPASSEHK